MNFQSLPFLLSILFFCVSFQFVRAEDQEKCYKGDELEYQNPCSEDPTNKLTYCPIGQRLNRSCTEECVYCEPGTYQDATYTNCTTCQTCITADDCPEGQEIIEICTSDSNAKCGCPPCPKCVTCPSEAPYTPPCTPCAPCSEQTTASPMSTIQAVAPDRQVEHKCGSCHQCWILVIVSVLFVVADIMLGLWVYRLKRNAHYEAIPGSSEDPEAHNIEMTKYQEDLKMKDKEICQLKEELKDLKKRLQTLSTQDVPASLPTKTNRQDSAQGGNSEKLGQAGNSKDAAPIAESEDLEDGGKSSTKANSKDLVKGGQEIAEPSDDTDKKVTKQEELNKKDEEIQVVESPVEEQQKESPNLSPEAGLRPSQSDRGVISQSGKVDQLKPDSVERQKSVSSRNNMEALFLYLSKELSEEWRGVGTRLGLSNAELNRIKSDSGSVRNAIYQMLLHWKQVNGSGARYETLMEALESESRKDLADDLRSGKAFKTSLKQSS